MSLWQRPQIQEMLHDSLNFFFYIETRERPEGRRPRGTQVKIGALHDE